MSKSKKFVLNVLFFSLIAVIPPSLEAQNNGAVLLSTDFQSKEEIFIVDGGFEYNYKFGNIAKDEENSQLTVKEVLEKIGVSLNEKDTVFPGLETVIKPGARIIIERATPVILNLYGSSKEIFTQKNKVYEFLNEQEIALKENDLINVDLNTDIFPGIKIKIWEKPKPKPDPVLAKSGRIQEGTASWYAFRSGDFAASTSFRKGTKLLVTNVENGCQVIVTVNDYGPFTSKIIDLERTAFAKLAPLKKGVIKVSVEELK